MGKKALEKKIKKAVLDVGLSKVIQGSKIFAVLKGRKEILQFGVRNIGFGRRSLT